MIEGEAATSVRYLAKELKLTLTETTEMLVLASVSLNRSRAFVNEITKREGRKAYKVEEELGGERILTPKEAKLYVDEICSSGWWQINYPDKIGITIIHTPYKRVATGSPIFDDY